MLTVKLTLIVFAVLHGGFAAVLPNSKLCTPKEEEVNLNELERRLPIGKIDCGEVVAYLRALSRYYNRRCFRMGNDCRDKDLYQVKWFDQIIKMMTQVCQQMDAAKVQTPETLVKPQTKKPPCGSRNRVM